MNLHSNLSYSTIFDRIEKETGRKFMTTPYNEILEYNKEKNAWVFYGYSRIGTNLLKQAKQDFIDSLSL